MIERAARSQQVEHGRKGGAEHERAEHERSREPERAEQDISQSRRVALRRDPYDNRRLLRAEKRAYHSPLVKASSASVRTATPVGPFGK